MWWIYKNQLKVNKIVSWWSSGHIVLKIILLSQDKSGDKFVEIVILEEVASQRWEYILNCYFVNLGSSL